MTGFSEYDQYDALGLAELVAGGQVSAEELLDEAIDRCQRINPDINAVVTEMFDIGRQEISKGLPDGPFRGVPFLIKDLLAAWPGVPMSCGSRYYKDWCPDYESEMVKRYRAAGLVVFGKTNTPELGIVGTTEPVANGITRNPWHLERTSGGSSGGSGAAVAAGIVPMASGGDGGGSLRIPGSCCGLVGMKATRGRNPWGPATGSPWFGQVQEGVLSRSVRDTAAALDATSGPDAGCPNFAPPPSRPFLKEVERRPGKLKIAFTTASMLGSGELHQECVEGLDRTVQLLLDLGHRVEEASPDIDHHALAVGYIMRIAAETAGDFWEAQDIRGRRPRQKDFERETWALANLGRSFSAADLSIANRKIDRVVRRVGQFMEDYDIFLTPTLAKPPVPFGAFKARGLDRLATEISSRTPVGPLARLSGVLDKLAESNFEFVVSTPLANITGEPSISLPLHWSKEGLPIGMMFTARFGEDARLLRLAAQLETARPWFDRRPTLHAGSG